MTEENKTEEQKPELEDALAKALKRFDDAEAELTDETDVKSEEKSEAKSEEAKSGDDQMEWPVPVYPLVAKFDVQLVALEDQDAIVIAIYTGAGASFGLVTREGAHALASRLKKTANGVVKR